MVNPREYFCECVRKMAEKINFDQKIIEIRSVFGGKHEKCYKI